MTFKLLPHTADVKVETEAKSLKSLFKESARALIFIMTQKEKIKEKKEKSFKISAKDSLELLYSFLEEFIYLLDAKNFIASKIKKITVSKNSLACTILGDKASNYNLPSYVKAVTYSEMEIKKTKKGFKGSFVLDL